MIPLRDDNPTTIRPLVTVGLIVACILIFLWQSSLGVGQGAAVYALGVIPAVLFGQAQLAPELGWVTPVLTPMTSMFLQGGIFHLLGNMLYLWIFGNNIEDAMGHGRFVVFYLLCGIAAVFAQALPDTSSVIPMIGASGAIGGVLGAYLINYPNARVLVLIPFGFFSQLIKIRALYVLGFWFILQFINSFLSSSSGGGVAYAAHIGGFITGLVLILFFNRKTKKKTYKRKVKKINKGPWEQ